MTGEIIPVSRVGAHDRGDYSSQSAGHGRGDYLSQQSRR